MEKYTVIRKKLNSFFVARSTIKSKEIEEVSIIFVCFVELIYREPEDRMMAKQLLEFMDGRTTPNFSLFV